MLNVTIHRKLQFTAAIVLAFLVAAATVYPLRIYTEDHVYSSGLGVSTVSEEVTEEHDAGDYFIAQYDHLQTLEFYVASVTSGTEAVFQLFHYVDQWTMELIAEETVELPDEVPGYVLVSVDADVEVGETYVYTVRGVDGSRFTVGFEALEEALDTGNAPYYTLGFYNDTTQEGLALQMRVTYRVALSKWPSLAMIAGFLLLAAVAILLIGKYYKLRPERNVGVTVLQAMQRVFTPVILLLGAAAFIAVWPMKLFDSRLPDILVYETGIVFAVLIALYALWHDRRGVPGTLSIHHLRRNVWHYFIIFCIALIMGCCADYMNATSDLQHAVSMNLIVALLCMIIYMMGDAKANLNAWVSRVFVIGTASGVIYYCVNRLPLSEPDAQLQNEILRTQAFAFVMAAIAVTATVQTLLQRRRAGVRPETAASKKLLGAVVILAAMLVLFCNTRLWILLLVGIWALFYLRYRYWSGRIRLLQDLCEGILLDFLFRVGYSMLRRYYMAYRFSRFSMHFHTVTVTAYYLVIVSAAALTLFVWKYRRTDGMPLKERMAHMWKETLLLGLAGAYMMMTLTRSGIGAFAILVVTAAAACGVMSGKKVRGFVSAIAAMAAAVLLTFPVTFTGQRLISTVYGQPDTFDEEVLGDYDDWLVRNVSWNCTRFMNIEIYLRDFGDRVIGGEIGSKLYYGLGWNVPQGYRTSEAEEDPVYKSGVVLASSEEASVVRYIAAGSGLSSSERAAGAGLLLTDTADSDGYVEGDLESGDITNGRLGLYIAYIRNLNMTGHETMGVELEDGEIAMHAHNIVLQVMHDCGIPTGVVYLIVLILLLAAAYQYAKRTMKNNPAGRDEAGGDYCRAQYAMAPFLLMAGFCVIGVVEWIFHFANPFTIAVLFSLAPVLFPEREETVGTQADKELPRS